MKRGCAFTMGEDKLETLLNIINNKIKELKGEDIPKTQLHLMVNLAKTVVLSDIIEEYNKTVE